VWDHREQGQSEPTSVLDHGMKADSLSPRAFAAQASKPERPRKRRVLVVDPHPLFRGGLVQLIHSQEEFVVCAEADSAPAAHAAVAAWNPEIIVLDLGFEAESGLALVRALKTASPKLRILVVSDKPDEAYAERALRTGADGYLLKSEPGQEVLRALRAVLSGELYVPPSMASRLLKRALQSPVVSDPGVGVLTDRELRVLELLGAGLKTGEIAGRLHLRRKTVDAHRENIKHKLGLQSATALASYACEWGQGHAGS
jgi:DNA-binding NarL/FixJ family response regulator